MDKETYDRLFSDVDSPVGKLPTYSGFTPSFEDYKKQSLQKVRTKKFFKAYTTRRQAQKWVVKKV